MLIFKNAKTKAAPFLKENCQNRIVVISTKIKN
jgi:hypothetical protein